MKKKGEKSGKIQGILSVRKSWNHVHIFWQSCFRTTWRRTGAWWSCGLWFRNGCSTSGWWCTPSRSSGSSMDSSHSLNKVKKVRNHWRIQGGSQFLSFSYSFRQKFWKIIDFCFKLMGWHTPLRLGIPGSTSGNHVMTAVVDPGFPRWWWRAANPRSSDAKLLFGYFFFWKLHEN